MAEVQPSPDQEMARSRLSAAYKQVFGQNAASRNTAQKAVWEDLEVRGYANDISFKTDKDGKLCPMRAAHADGARGLFLYIRQFVRMSFSQTDQETTKPRKRK